MLRFPTADAQTSMNRRLTPGAWASLVLYGAGLVALTLLDRSLALRINELEAERRAGITLTESCAMLPTASVSGMYFWNPGAAYFGVGRIGRDQVEDYARRKGVTLREVERWLAPNLDYDPDA